MSRSFFTLKDEAERKRVARLVYDSPIGSRVELKASRRSLPQNDRMWAMLTDISDQVQWHGLILETEDWKLLFIDALKRELRIVPNLDGNGFVNLGRSSSDLSKEEMSDLIELLFMFGANHNIAWKDPEIASQVRQLEEMRAGA
jgi:hypothetical protein